MVAKSSAPRSKAPTWELGLAMRDPCGPMLPNWMPKRQSGAQRRRMKKPAQVVEGKAVDASYMTRALRLLHPLITRCGGGGPRCLACE